MRVVCANCHYVIHTQHPALRVDELKRLISESWTPWSEKGSTRKERSIEGYLTSGYKDYIAEEDGLLAGVAAVRDNRHVFHLFVAEAHQGRGVARSLWEYARDACRKAGKTDAITVNSSTFAVEMYRKFGFIETGPPETKSGVTTVPMKRSETD